MRNSIARRNFLAQKVQPLPWDDYGVYINYACMMV